MKSRAAAMPAASSEALQKMLVERQKMKLLRQMPSSFERSKAKILFNNVQD
jgi:hypothetical protein